MNVINFLLFAIVVSIMHSVSAAEYSFAPVLSSRILVDDNIRLTSQQHNTVVGNVTSVRTDLRYRNPESSLRFTPQFQLRRYGDDVGLEAENVVLDFSGSHSLNEQLGFSLSSKIADQNVGVIDPNTAGLTFNEITQEITRYSPSVSYQINDKHFFQLSYQYSEIEYEDGLQIALVGNETDSIQFFYNYAFNEQIGFNLSLSHSLTDIPDTNLQRDSSVFDIGLNYFYSETLSLEMNVGANFSESEFDAFRINGNRIQIERDTEGVLGETYSFDVEKKFEYTTISASLGRNVIAGNRGDQDIRDRYSVNVSRKMTDKLVINLKSFLIMNESQQSLGLTNNNFESLSAIFQLNYQYSDNLRLISGYQYRTTENENSNTEAESNQVYFELAYNFDPMIWSR